MDQYSTPCTVQCKQKGFEAFACITRLYNMNIYMNVATKWQKNLYTLDIMSILWVYFTAIIMFCKNKTKALYRIGEQFDGQFISLALAQLTRIRPTNSNQCIQTHSDTFSYIQVHSDAFRYIQMHSDTFKYIPFLPAKRASK